MPPEAITAASPPLRTDRLDSVKRNSLKGLGEVSGSELRRQQAFSLSSTDATNVAQFTDFGKLV